MTQMPMFSLAVFCNTAGLSAPVEQVSTPVSLLLTWASCVLCVFQGFTYVLYEGECCGRCLPSACEVVTGSPRGDSQSSWKEVGLGPRVGGREQGSGFASLPVHCAAQCWPWFQPVKLEFIPCPLLSPHGVNPAVGSTQTSARLALPLRN